MALWPVTPSFMKAVSRESISPFAKNQQSTGSYPYQLIGPLFTPAERSFLAVLNSILKEDVHILGKVRVADILKPLKGLKRSEWQKAFNKISSKHFDFVLSNKNDLSLICVVKPNNKSHNTKQRKERDDFLEKACEAASLPLIQIPPQAGYSLDEVKRQLAPYIPSLQVSQLEGKSKECPKCTSTMVVRIAQKGEHKNKHFWGCSTYPKCRYTELYEIP